MTFPDFLRIASALAFAAAVLVALYYWRQGRRLRAARLAMEAELDAKIRAVSRLTECGRFYRRYPVHQYPKASKN